MEIYSIYSPIHLISNALNTYVSSNFDFFYIISTFIGLFSIKSILEDH